MLVVGTNTYGTLDAAGVHFSTTINKEAWRAFGQSNQEIYMAEAFRYMQRLNWKGNKVDPSQIPAFPRNNMRVEGVAEGATPSEIPEAQFEIAFRIGQDPDVVNSIGDTTLSNLKRGKAEGAEVEFFRPVTGNPLFPWVRTLIQHLLGGSSGSSRVFGPNSSGTSCPPNAHNPDYGLTDSYH